MNEKMQMGEDFKGTPSLNPVSLDVPTTLKEKKEFVLEETFSKSGKITVKPFVNPNHENMGLERYNYSIFPNTYQMEQLAAIEINGVVRYITGLDEYAKEVQNIRDVEVKKSIITNIRNVVAHLEKLLATNVVDVEDADFWNKVQLLRPDNHDFWSRISIKCENKPLHLNPSEDPYDLIKLMAIEAGGFDLIAKSWDDAIAKPTPPKFYLDKEVNTVSTKTAYKKLKNRALVNLNAIADNQPVKLLYIVKSIDPNGVSYKTNTPQDILYDTMDEYILGNGVERNKSKAAQHFIDTTKMSMENLKLKAITKDAIFLKLISLKADGMMYHTSSSVMLGRNVSDVIEFLKVPTNDDVLNKVMAEVEEYWKS